LAIVTNAGWGAVDAAASGAQRDAGRVWEGLWAIKRRTDERCCSGRRSRVVL